MQQGSWRRRGLLYPLPKAFKPPAAGPLPEPSSPCRGPETRRRRVRLTMLHPLLQVLRLHIARLTPPAAENVLQHISFSEPAILPLQMARARGFGGHLMKAKQSGFTLVELIVVIVILGILAAT